MLEVHSDATAVLPGRDLAETQVGRLLTQKHQLQLSFKNQLHCSLRLTIHNTYNWRHPAVSTQVRVINQTVTCSMIYGELCI